jgi:ADP-heptose:LPS heptosyltransferase
MKKVKSKKRILVIRFSALGDVAMTVPMIASLAAQYPEHEVIVLTRKNYTELFSMISGNISVVGADLKDTHAGLSGLLILFSEIRKLKPNVVVDLHSVLRSHLLRILFALTGVKTRKINKGRREKEKLTRQTNKVFLPLLSTFERYALVFKRAGFRINPYLRPVLNPLLTREFSETGKIQIGIAPFAKHEGKIYPPEKTEEVIRLLSEENLYRIVLFGGGKKETEMLEKFQSKYPHTISIAGKYNLTDEISLMRQLKVMVTMDSANMHLAALAGTQVVSIWGATHSYAGFGAWDQPESNKVEIELDCRPCSVYGNKTCFRGDMACMNRISPEMIIEKIKKCL